MLLCDVAVLRTGAVLSRLQVSENSDACFRYDVLNLRNIDETGRIHRSDCIQVCLREQVQPDTITEPDDILVRLSYPYTVIYIDSECDCGLLVPSHFGIVRTKGDILPKYLYAILDSSVARKDFALNASGSTILGTISIKNIGTIQVPLASVERQQLIGCYHNYAKKEIRLLEDLTNEKARLLSLTNKKIIGQAKGERV